MKYSDAELEAYLDEALAADEMAAVEASLRADGALTKRLADIIRRREAGIHSLGDVWRRHRLTCPTREQLGSFLLGVLDADLAEYIKFHVREVHCRLCAANLDDLKAQQTQQPTETATRRKKYFESSAGYLRSK